LSTCTILVVCTSLAMCLVSNDQISSYTRYLVLMHIKIPEKQTVSSAMLNYVITFWTIFTNNDTPIDQGKDTINVQ